MPASEEKKSARSLPAATLAALLPTEMNGWRADKADRLADADTLFDLIDGGAEVYRALNVQSVVEREYQRTGHALILVDLFDMGSDADAYGAYRNDVREHPDPGIGNGSEHETSSLFFWKGRFFVAVVATEETAEAIAAVLALGKAIAGNIKQAGKPPRLVGLLPASGLNKQELYFFHSAESLERLVPAARGNPLGLSAGTAVVLARYRRGGASSDTLLLLVEYPTPAAAKAVQQQLAGLAALRGDNIQVSIAAIAQRHTLLCAVLDTADRAAAAKLCEETLANAKGKPQ